MKQQLVFATANAHKVTELQAIAGPVYEILSLADIGCTDEIPEDGDTLEENALLKARYVLQRYGLPCFGEDTGLEVPALDMAPGVYSARYAGPQKDSAANMAKLLNELADGMDRSARFRTCIALADGKQERLFEGVVHGHIAAYPAGSGGFGYDPVFIPDGYEETFAQLASETKNSISHRARATSALIAYLRSTGL